MSKNLSQQVVLDRRGFVAASFATVAGLGLAGCSDTSAEADKGSAASSKSSEDTEVSTTLDAKAFDKLVDNGPKADDDAIAASAWATAVKDAGVFKIGGVQTSTLFSLLNEKDGQTRGFDAGIAQLLSTATISAIVAIIGIIFRTFVKKKPYSDIGDIMLGFAILMFGMQTMSGAVSPLKENPHFVSLLTMFKNPFMGILVGIAFTAVLQSASASVGILQFPF